MKLSRFSKKVIAIVCAVAMVVAGFAFAPSKDATADVDPSSLTYISMTSGDVTIGYAVVNQNIAGWANFAFLDGGVTFQIAYSADNKAADTEIEINDVVTTSGAVSYIGDAIVKLNPTQMTDNAYTKVEITTTTGSALMYIKRGEPETQSQTQTQTETPSGETESTTEPQVNWVNVVNGAGRKYDDSTEVNVVGWQNPGWEGQLDPGIYTNPGAIPTSVTINGVTTAVSDSGNYDTFYVQGTGILFYNRAFTQEITEITIVAGTTKTLRIRSYAVEDAYVKSARNLALLGTGSDTGKHREGNVEQLNDGQIFDWDNRDGITVNSGEGYPDGSFDITLDKAYDAASIDQVYVWWRTSDSNFYPSTYKVQFGYQGVFHDVDTTPSYPTPGSIGTNSDWNMYGRYVTSSDFTSSRLPSSPVDTVRIYIDTNVQYGAQAREVGVYSVNPQDAPTQPQADDPAGITASSPDYETIVYNIEAGQGQDDYLYNVYLGDTEVGHQVEAGQDITINSLEPGTYTLKVVSTCEGMDPSDGIYSDPVTVADPADMITGPNNVAIGGEITAVSSFYSDSYDIDKAQCAIDGTPRAGEESDRCLRTGANQQPATIDIDLGKQYDVSGLKYILLQYTNPRTYAANTQITVSDDGVNYNQVANETGYVAKKDGSLNTNLIKSESGSLTGTFRYVRISLSNGANGWGYVVNQIAIIADNGLYDVADYKGEGQPYTYPEKAGKIFAGWYTDDTCEAPYIQTTGTAYAKFIDEDVLGPVAFQEAKNEGGGVTAVRFLSTLDCEDYTSAGFIINGTYGNASIVNKTRYATKLYTSVKAAGETVLPSDIFSDESAYFFTYTVSGLNPETNVSFNAVPFYVTADGTTVKGTAGEYPQS